MNYKHHFYLLPISLIIIIYIYTKEKIENDIDIIVIFEYCQSINIKTSVDKLVIDNNFVLFEETRRPLVKALIKNDVCSFLLHNLRAVADDRGLGQDISLQIHQILSIIGHHGLSFFHP